MGDNFAPSFVQKPKLRQEDDGNKLIFDCQLRASPPPEIAWFRGDEAVKESARIKITCKANTGKANMHDVQLILDDVEEEDAGLYKVKAKNKYGEVSASINLNFSRKYSFYCLMFVCVCVMGGGKGKGKGKTPSSGFMMKEGMIIAVEEWGKGAAHEDIFRREGALIERRKESIRGVEV